LSQFLESDAELDAKA